MSRVSHKAKIWIALWTVYILWGSTYLGIELASETIPPFFAAGTRFLIAGTLMLGLVAIQALCTLFVDYQGHVMGAKMERDMRRELFAHYQRLSFSFFDRQRTDLRPLRKVIEL